MHFPGLTHSHLQPDRALPLYLFLVFSAHFFHLPRHRLRCGAPGSIINYHSIHVAFWKSYMAASSSPDIYIYMPIEAEGFPSQLRFQQVLNSLHLSSCPIYQMLLTCSTLGLTISSSHPLYFIIYIYICPIKPPSIITPLHIQNMNMACICRYTSCACICIYIYNIQTLIIHAKIKLIPPKSQPIPTVDPTVAQICPGAVSAAPTTKGAIGAGAGVVI